MIYNMTCQKTVALVALLNLFSLNLALGDEFYDTLKAKKKYDSKTVNEVRKETVEKARIQEMNARTQNDPNYKPLPKTPFKPPLSDEEFKKLKDADKLSAQDADDKIPEKPPGYVEPKDDEDEPDTTKLAAPAKAPPRNSTAPKDVYNSTPVKVTTDDPDEVKFEEEEKPAHHVKPAPTPIKKK